MKRHRWLQQRIQPRIVDRQRFEVAPPFIRASHCHCSRCRKHSGTYGEAPREVAGRRRAIDLALESTIRANTAAATIATDET